MNGQPKTVEDFLAGKSEHTKELFHHFVTILGELAAVTLHPAKTMIGISNGQRRIAWITRLGKNFIHVVFPFKQPHPDNLCFQKIAQVPGDNSQYNHHFQMLYKEDVNEELRGFMKMAYEE